MRIFHELAGTGPPLLFLNGVMMSTESWALQKPAFTPHFRCLFHDFRGQGKSEMPPGPYEMSMHVDDLVALLDELEIESADVVGTSYGGEVGLMFAIAHPERVRALVVIAATSEPRETMENGVASWIVAARTHPEALFDISSRTIYAPGFLTSTWINLGRARLATMPPEWFRAFADLCEAFSRLDIRRDLPKITAPTLVIAGELDALKPIGNSEVLAREIPNARLKIVPGAGHAAFIERPNVVNEMILDFLRRHE